MKHLRFLCLLAIAGQASAQSAGDTTYQKEYQDGEKLWQVTAMVNGQRNGVHRVYAPDGSLELEAYYKDDLLHGTEKEWHSRKKLKSVATYSNNKLQGKRVLYDENGRVQKLTHFRDGLEHGTEIDYDRRGKPEIVTFHREGVGIEYMKVSELEKFKKKIGADSLLFNLAIGDGIFKTRSRQTGLWGMYQKSEEPKMLVPMQYDSLSFIIRSDEPVLVWKNRRAGLYANGFQVESPAEVLPCIHDAAIIIERQGRHHFLLKKDGRWGVALYNDQGATITFSYESAEQVQLD